MKKKEYFFVLPIGLFISVLFASNYTKRTSNFEYVSVVRAETKDPHKNFNKMMDVLMHPRCINCHPSDNIPKQGMEGHAHYFGMKGGENDQGFESTKCMTCHQKENNNFSGVPGAPHWGLAPQSMGWKGLTRAEIATVMLDKSKNGGKNYEEIEEHLTKDDLVLWAWNPGVNAAGHKRETPPISKEEFKKVVKEWFANGAIIPKN